MPTHTYMGTHQYLIIHKCKEYDSVKTKLIINVLNMLGYAWCCDIGLYILIYS